MNYSNLPVYIKQWDGVDALPFANIYDPPSAQLSPFTSPPPPNVDNSLYFTNQSAAQTISIEYVNSLITRVSGGASTNSEQLFAPRITLATPTTNPAATISLPRFRSLMFFNSNGTRTQDPFDPGEFLPPLYFEKRANPAVDYVSYDREGYILRLRHSGTPDSYTLDYYDVDTPTTNPIRVFYNTTGANFGNTASWLNSSNQIAGIFCSGFGATANDVLNAINNPTGSSPYHSSGSLPILIKNSAAGSVSLTGRLFAAAVDSSTGYVAPHSRLTLGKAYHYVPAQSSSVEYQAQNDADRKLGIDIDVSDQFSNGAPLQAKINFNSYINSETSGALKQILESSGENSYSIRVGSNVYDDCYLSNYDISVEPFRPASIAASYTVNNAPKINLNQLNFVPVTTPASRNLLLYSESLTGSNYVYTNAATTPNQPDPTGGFAATLISGQDSTVNTVSYLLDNTGSYTWSSITGAGGGTVLDSLKNNNDRVTGVSFTAGKTFTIGATSYLKVWISNNGIISFDASDTGFSSAQSDDLPILSLTRKFIAAYWRDMAAAGGSILYKQNSDRFIIEYAAVNAIIGAEPQTYQIHLVFATGDIEIRYKSVTESGVFRPNANIGIQWAVDKFINYDLAFVDTTKALKFIRKVDTTATAANFIYKTKITPDAQRTFSIHLKREVGDGDVRYSTNSGVNWFSIIPRPSIDDGWIRYSFPSTSESQQVGIRIDTSGDAVYAYGAQLEPLTYSTEYIPTQGVIQIRPQSTVNIPTDFLYPEVSLTTGFANTMINGDNCSVSSTAGFASNIQTSMRYSVSCARTPVYNIGTTNANRHILDTVEKQMDISSTNLASFIDFSGSKLTSDLNLTLKNSQNSFSSIISMKSGANIFSQQTNIQEGDTLATQVSIKEIIV
jgi:hypothetical protein